MVKKVKKRDGRVVDFEREKIIQAITKAGYVKDNIKEKIASEVENLGKDEIDIEEIQDAVEKKLMSSSYKDVAREYVRYRYKHEILRQSQNCYDNVLDIVSLRNAYVAEENSNKNSVILSTQRDYIAGEVSKDLTFRLLLPEEVVKAHNEGILHFHDADYFIQNMYNCALINLEDILQNGTVINGTLIEKPHSFATACNIATQVMASIASNQYGGQSETLAHLAPFVEVSRQHILKDVLEEFKGLDVAERKVNEVVEKRVKDEIKRGVQTMQYQINTLMTSNGQTPFVTIFMCLGEVPEGRTRDDLALIIEEVLRQRLQGVKNEKGVWVTPAFPKLIYVLDEYNIHEDSPYWYLTKLSAKCSAKRLVPDYVSAKMMRKYKVDENGNGNVYPPMGCRSFLTPYVDEDGNPKYYGRFNQGVVTINLVDVGLSANRDFKKFWEIFDERLELCHKALQCRHQRLEGTLSDVSPIHWQYGAIARLNKGEKIDKLLHGGYSTISLGYAGLYECVLAMTGKSHTDEDAKPFALQIMQHMNDKCAEWRADENIAYSLYGTPLETTTYKFARTLKERFGEIEGITDHNYVTNSYHVNVREKIDPFTKLSFESDFQVLSPGGMISYIESANMMHNLDAVLEVIKFIYDTIMYAEINTKSDYCMECDYSGEIKIVEKDDKLIWKCPNCGNTDQRKMSVARRTCGRDIAAVK